MKTYKVNEPFAYRGYEPGDTFQAQPSEVENALNRGSVEEVKASAPAPASAQAKTSSEAKPKTDKEEK
jgi:hypothetical protein